MAVYDTMISVESRKGFPDVDDQESCLLLLDDMMYHLESGMAYFFTKGSHHKNTSVIAVTLNVCHQRDLSVLTHNIVLLRIP